MSVSLGIIGAGKIGAAHVEAALAAGIHIAAVVDLDEDRASALAGQCDATAMSDARDIWNSDAIDALIIAVPNCFHKALTIEALRAGKDVLLEKPMGMNTAECQEIMKVASETGKLVQVGLTNRYSAVGKAAKRFVGDGALGEIYHTKGLLYRRRGVPGLGGWFTTKSKSGGGALIDLGVHAIDLAMYLMEFPQAVEVCGQVYNTFGCRMRDYVYEDMWAGPPNYDGVCDVDDAAHALIRLAGGKTLDLNVTWAGDFPTGAVPESQMVLFGDQGGLTFALDDDHILLAREQAGYNVDTKVTLPPCDHFVEQLVDFVAATQTRQIKGATAHEATIVQSLIDAIYDSSEQGRAVAVPTIE